MHAALLFVPLLGAAPTLAQLALWQPQWILEQVAALNARFEAYLDYTGPSPSYWTHHKKPTPQPYPGQPGGDTCDYWLADIKHQGIAAFNADPSSYIVFRDVKDYGATGDGVTDDTAAINLAISSGGRCGPSDCASTTVTPAVVYFPPGTYLITSSIIDYYYTQLIGNPNCIPTIRANATFASSSFGLIDGDQYQDTGDLGFGATNVFWRQIRNFVIDMTLISYTSAATGIHWPTAQATSIQNVEIQMSSVNGTQHIGLYSETGSGGFLDDMVFNGGAYGAILGNQQFTMRNLTFNGAVTAIDMAYDWGWLYTGITISNCTLGLDMSGTISDLAVGSVTFIDSVIENTPVFIHTGYVTNVSEPATANSLILENIFLSNVPVAIEGGDGTTVLAGTPTNTHIAGWGEGHSYTPDGPNVFQGPITPVSRPASLTVGGGDYYVQSKPQYQQYPVSSFISARSEGATGNGHTDDTAALQRAIDLAVAENKLLFVDQGDYLVSDTITIPPGSRIIGESYSVILSHGDFFNDISNPQPVIQIGTPGETGTIAWSEMIVSTQGQQEGAILIQYNLASPSSDPSGIWDVHSRVGGFAGSNLSLAECPTSPDITVTAANLNYNCIAAFMTFHVAPTGSGLYLENNWFWTADHDVDNADLTQITIYNGRGFLDESTTGTVWMLGTAVEHDTKYQYQFYSTKNVFAGLIQTETPYYQPNPAAPFPFPYSAEYHDPTFPGGNQEMSTDNLTIPDADAWGLRVVDSSSVSIYGAGLYSFFNNYSTACSDAGDGEYCQSAIFDIVGSCPHLTIYTLSTVGTHWMIDLNGDLTAIYSDNLNVYPDTIALVRDS